MPLSWAPSSWKAVLGFVLLMLQHTAAIPAVTEDCSSLPVLNQPKHCHIRALLSYFCGGHLPPLKGLLPVLKWLSVLGERLEDLSSHYLQ